MASPDYKGDIERIIAILKNNTAIFDTANPDGKLNEIYFGEDNHQVHDSNPPYALVTTPQRPFLTKDSFGIGEGSTDPQISVQYVIKVFTHHGGDPKEAEKQLYDFIKEIVTTLKANPRLKDPLEDPVGPPVVPADPKCIRSFIVDVVPLSDKRGQEVQGAEILIQCQIGSQYTLDIAGFTGIPLISKPIEREVETTENIYDTARIRKNVSSITETHSFFAEMEYIEAHVAALRTQKRNRATISATLTRPSGATVYSGKLTEISNGASFDQLETVTIRFEVIH